MNDVDRFAPQALALIKERADAEEKAILLRVEQKFEAEGQLTPEFAVQQWMALIELRRLVRRVETTDRAVTSRRAKEVRLLDGKAFQP